VFWAWFVRAVANVRCPLTTDRTAQPTSPRATGAYAFAESSPVCCYVHVFMGVTTVSSAPGVPVLSPAETPVVFERRL
jgi:hypothetical protein